MTFVEVGSYTISRTPHTITESGFAGQKNGCSGIYAIRPITVQFSGERATCPEIGIKAHAERVSTKLVGFNDLQRQALEQVRSAVWQLYRDLKHYQTEPTPQVSQALKARFEALCTTPTCFAFLNQALKRMHRSQDELFLVLKRPELPLHNNLSESDIREYVKRRKISGGTRSEQGRRGRDTFASLKKTCRKLGLSFWNYLKDRIQGEMRIPSLSALIEARAQAP